MTADEQKKQVGDAAPRSKSEALAQLKWQGGKQ
jgi:hypothetical protein